MTTSEVPTLPSVPLAEDDFLTHRFLGPFSSPVTYPVAVAAISPVPLADRIS